jgi:hypothetical protein
MKRLETQWTELADAVAAGTAIDWDSVAADVTDEQDRRVLAQFKVLAVVAEVYRQRWMRAADCWTAH